MNEPNAVAVAREYVAAYDRGEPVERYLGPTLGQIYAVFTALIATDDRARRLHEALTEIEARASADGFSERLLFDIAEIARAALAAPLAEEGTK